MIKLFFITFFIAELIIAMAVIIKIYQFNKYVNDLNSIVLSSQEPLRTLFVDFRVLFEYFNINFNKLRELITQKREEYILKVLKTTIFYTVFFFLKGKYKKAILAYQVFKEIFDGIKES